MIQRHSGITVTRVAPEASPNQGEPYRTDFGSPNCNIDKPIHKTDEIALKGGHEPESARALIAAGDVRNIQEIIRNFYLASLRTVHAAWSKPTVRRVFQIAAPVVAVPLLFAVFALIYLNFNRTDLPDLQAFLRFEPPTIGHVYDVNGQTLIELAHERRQIIQYKDLPDVVRQAILSAEDKNFFSHSGVDYSVFLRLLGKINIHAMFARASNSGRDPASDRALVFPQGGSTITQQLVRGYFLQKLTSTEGGNTLLHHGPLPHILAFFIGVPAANKFLRKLEEMRLALYIESEMIRHFGSKRRAKEELLARYCSFIYLGNGRYGFAAASQYYFGKPIESFTTDDADKAALLAGIPKSPGDYAPTVADLQKPLHRRNQILALMVTNHFISADAALHCQQVPIRLAPHPTEPMDAPAAIENVLEELKSLTLNAASEDLPNTGIDQLLDGRIQVHSTVDSRIQLIAGNALENGLMLYEKRHSRNKGLIQGSVVVLRNSDSAILAEMGGRRLYKAHKTTYSDFNRVTQSARQPGSAMKPIVYLAAFRQGALDLNTLVPDEPISVARAGNRPAKWISNFDGEFKGMIPARQALAESRNAVAIWITDQIGIESVLQTALNVGIRTKLQPYVTTSLGASEVTLLELANAYRFMATGIQAGPHVIDKIVTSGGEDVFTYHWPCCDGNEKDWGLSMIQEGLRGVVRIPGGTAHALDSHFFPIPVMGKTGTTSGFRDALFVGSTYGPEGITVAVRIGFDDNSSLGTKETGGMAALPVFREIMLKVYQQKLAGPVPTFPADMESNITAYLEGDVTGKEVTPVLKSPDGARLARDGTLFVGMSVDVTKSCGAGISALTPMPCGFTRPALNGAGPRQLLHPLYKSTDGVGRSVFTNQ